VKRDLTRASMWGRTSAHTRASATVGTNLVGVRVRVALAAALALLGALALATPASAFVKATSFDGSYTPARVMVPERMAVDTSTGDVYVIDAANNVVDRFNRYGKYLSQLTVPAGSGGTFGFDDFEDSVAVDNSSTATQGNVYVVGENGSLISAFRSDGTFMWQVTSVLAGHTTGVAVDPTNGDLWISNRDSGGMIRLNAADGSSRGDTPLGTDQGLAHIAFDSAGNLYGNSSQGETVKYARQVGTPEFVDPPSFFDTNFNAANDVSVDLVNGDVYIGIDFGILVYDSADNQVSGTPFGSTLSRLSGVAVDGAADHIYVSNNDTNSVEIWSHDPGLRMDALTVTAAGTGTGSVAADHGAIAGCGGFGGTCSDNYIDGDTVELTATADAGMTFDGWSGPDAGACTTATVCDVPMDAAKNITATFSPTVTTHTLTVDKSGSGSATSSPAGIACGATCSAQFDDGTSVTVTATPDANNVFSGWTGCDSASGTNCTVDMTSDRTVTATFVAQHTLSVSKNGTGSGTVTSSPAGIACGATCSALFNNGTSITLTAAADANSTFAGWSGGGCSGTGTCNVNLGADTGVTATFTQNSSGGGGGGGGGGVCPQDLTKCPPPSISFAGFNSKTLLVSLRCSGFAGQPACSGKLTFKAVIKVRVKHGKKTRLVKKTITVATASYSVAAGGSGSVKLKLTSAAKAALKRGALTAKSTNPSATIHLPKTKVRKKKRH